MSDLLLIALAGFCASMVDGALGMGFGPTSSSILLSAGLTPAATSATVNIAKVATGLAAGASHWRFGNIDRRLVTRLALPGIVGAALGATVLASVDGAKLRPYLALLLLAVGARILLRFSKPLPSTPATVDADRESNRVGRPVEYSTRGVEVVAAVGGVTNGLVGAWGPVVTPFLLHRGFPPRFAVGSVNTAEVAVAVVSVGTLFSASAGSGLRLDVIIAMLVGGVVAAPLAAHVVRFIAPRILGLAVAGLLLFTQGRELAGNIETPGSRWLGYCLLLVALTLAAIRPRIGRATRIAP